MSPWNHYCNDNGQIIDQILLCKSFCYGSPVDEPDGGAIQILHCFNYLYYNNLRIKRKKVFLYNFLNKKDLE